jgi:peptide deformylase
MIETMHDADGVGLAAPQVGVLRRVVVIDIGDGPIEMVNPKILESSGEQGGMEGCLSFPGKSGYVVRPNYVKVEAYDRHGDLYEYEGEELFARAVFHECDHLDGKVYLRLITDPPEGFKEE